MIDGVLIRVGLEHGVVLSAAMSLLVAGSLRQDPMIWARSSPPDVQAFVGPPSPASRRRRKAWAVVMLCVLVVVFGHLAREVGPGETLGVAIAAWITFQLFNLYDALVIDLGLVLLQPRWAFVPGTENLPGLRDPRWHVRNYVKGFVGGFVFAGMVAGVAWGFA